MIKYVRGDLFKVDKNIPLVHCISADFALGAGIAKQFRNKYPDMIEAMKNAKTPHVTDIFPFESNDSRHKLVLNMITKQKYFFKPTRENFNLTLDNLHNYLIQHNIDTIAMPKIGAGLDRLYWKTTETYLNTHFSDINVYVYYFD